MYKIIIKDLNGKRIGGIEKESIDEINEYLDLIDTKERPWHQPKEGRYCEIPIGTVTYTEEVETDEFNNTRTVYILPKHYTVETIDLTQDYDFKLQECYRKRIEAYGSLGDQLDEIYKDMNAWKARIAKVKNDHPKPIK